VAELVRHHQCRDEAAELVRQLAEEGAVVADGVAVRCVLRLAVEGVVLDLGRVRAAADALRVRRRVDVARVDAEVAALQRDELRAEDVGQLPGPVVLEVGERVAGPAGPPADR
jgi:hypothetical protein